MKRYDPKKSRAISNIKLLILTRIVLERYKTGCGGRNNGCSIDKEGKLPIIQA